MKIRFAGWELSVAMLAGVAAGFTLPANFYSEGAAEIVTVLGFLIAAFVPAMALGATAIRAGGFSVKRIRMLGVAIDKQIKVFGGLFIYTIMACAITILGKLLKWSLPKFVVGQTLIIDLGPVFPAILTALLTFLCLRSVAFIEGISSILSLQTKIAEDEARARDRIKDKDNIDELAAYKLPETYGANIDIK